MAELRRLAKTCNFGDYLDTAIRDQFVCGLSDLKCQKELLCTADLMVAVALQKARAVEVVTQEAKAMQEPSQATTGQEEDMHKLSIHLKCYCWATVLWNANIRRLSAACVRKLDT